MADADKILSVEEVSKVFRLPRRLPDRLLGRPERALLAVSGVSFSLARGSTLAVVGESGCGKSTLARIVCGLHAPDAGRIVVDGRALPTRRTRADRRRIQMIFQDPFASLNPRWRVRDIIAEPMREHMPGTSRMEREERVRHLLATVGLPQDSAAKYPHAFSGGQRQRISIARAMATTPDVLVCDEPTSALDVSVQAQVLNMMRDLQEATGISYIFISHDLAVVDYMASEIAVMYLGEIVEHARRDALMTSPRHPYTRLLMDALPDVAAPRRPRHAVRGEPANPLSRPAGCPFHPRCGRASKLCRSEKPVLTRSGDHAIACHHA